jgi:hypothetical protein
MAGAAGNFSMRRERHVRGDPDVPRSDIHRMQVAFGKDLLVAPCAQGRYGRRHLAFQDFSVGIGKMAGEAFLKSMRVRLHAVNDDADENSANQQGNDEFLPHRVTMSIA